MNILFLANHLNVGGITSYLLSLAKGLKKKGHRIYIAASSGDSLTRFTEKGIIYIPIPIRTKSELDLFKIGASFLRLLPQLRQNQIDIIHSNTRVTQVLGFFLSKAGHKPHLTTWHGFFKVRLGRRLFPFWPDKIIAISEAVNEHLNKGFLAPAKDIRLVYSGIDLEGLKLRNFTNRQEAKKSFGLSPEAVVGIVARLSDVKGHSYLIRAMKAVLAKFPAAQLLIVGEGRMEKKLRRLCRELGIEKSVFFIPRVYDMPQLFYAIDIFVMPSLEEGLGLGLMEAMAWAKPVIGSEVGGIKNLIRHQENGLLVPAANVSALGNAILELLNDPLKALALGNNARVMISERFSLDKMVDETERVYLECLDTRKQ